MCDLYSHGASVSRDISGILYELRDENVNHVERSSCTIITPESLIFGHLSGNKVQE